MRKESMQASPEMKSSEYKLLEDLFDELFPICRSISGPGYQRSLEIISRGIPFESLKFQTGDQVFDWQVPPEWVIRDAYLIGPDGDKVVDFKKNNLHVLNFSEPVDRYLELEELQKHLHSIPELPTAIPYVTSYYKRAWGFCLAHEQRKLLKPGKYRAVVDSEFKDGHVIVGEHVLPGESSREVLLSTYLCHPSMANNELSGPLVQLGLYNRIKSWPKRRLTYRFVILPETIGSICYLSRCGEDLKQNLLAGLVLTCLGGDRTVLSYKKSRNEKRLIDRLVEYLREAGFEHFVSRPFSPLGGSDERQYCSPGFNLPVGQFARNIYGEYEGYHNSLDTKEFMRIDAIVESTNAIERVLMDLEHSMHFENLSPYGEVQLGRRGLYPNMNSHASRESSDDKQVDGREQLNRILTILNYSDGEYDMLEISKKLKLRPFQLSKQIELLEKNGLLKLIQGMPQ